jgi:light-regulated signal transduction histidine kinase (bacteriophytochrome)
MTDAQRIAQLEAELATARAQMQELTYTVSHDLRAPLRHVVSYAKLVQAEAGPQLDDELRGFLDTVVDSANHMGLLLDGLLALSRIDSAPLHIASVALADVMLEVQAPLVRAYPQTSILWSIAPDLPVVQADATLLRTALTQVLDNAVKFSAAPASAQPVHITLGWQRTVNTQGAECITLIVQDSGVGYDPTQQGALFQVFGRLSNAKGVAGGGVGLLMARKALARLQGNIEIAGKVGQGCCVTLQIPV